MDPIGIFLMGGSALSLVLFLFLEFRSRRAPKETTGESVKHGPEDVLVKPPLPPEAPTPTPPKPPLKPVTPVPVISEEQLPKKPIRTPPFPPLFAKLLKS